MPETQPVAVFDAKYKLEGASSGYPNADAYQMLAYCTALRRHQGFLVYAKDSGERERRAVRTTNAVERRFREVRRRTRPMGTFQDKTSMDRILFAVFTHENKSQGVSTPFLLTQNI